LIALRIRQSEQRVSPLNIVRLKNGREVLLKKLRIKDKEKLEDV
jgi:hypothetical protein